MLNFYLLKYGQQYIDNILSIPGQNATHWYLFGSNNIPRDYCKSIFGCYFSPKTPKLLLTRSCKS